MVPPITPEAQPVDRDQKEGAQLETVKRRDNKLFIGKGGMFVANQLERVLGWGLDVKDFQGGVYGNSSGAALLAGLLAGQTDAIRDFILNVAADPEVMNPKRLTLKNLIKKSDDDDYNKVVRLDRYIGELLNRLDLEKVFAAGNPPFYIGVVKTETGKHEYIRATRKNFAELIRATHSIGGPITGHSFISGDNGYEQANDGGYGETIPLEVITDALDSALLGGGSGKTVIMVADPLELNTFDLVEKTAEILAKISRVMGWDREPDSNKVLQTFAATIKTRRDAIRVLKDYPDLLEKRVLMAAPKERDLGMIENKRGKIEESMRRMLKRAEADRQRYRDFMDS